MITKFKKKIKHKLNWEYWPSWAFYLPNIPYAFYLAIKAKNLVFFSNANPSIKSSGNGFESKFETLKLIPENLKPKSVLVFPNTDINTVKNLIEKKDIKFPLIVKPDIGFRGLLVKKITSYTELEQYLTTYPLKIIIQEFISYTNECGIFYYRKPNEQKGKITSLTLKNFLSVTGNGKLTLKELILNDERAKIYFDIFSEIHNDIINIPVKKNKTIKLTEIGNHSKGTEFINGNHLITQKLEDTFNQLSYAIDGWYYGRVDIKYNTFEELEQNINFKILEINGIIAEPTHIYDKKSYTYLKALKTIREHWKALYEISTTNSNFKNKKNKKTIDFIKEMIKLRKYINKIQKLNLIKI